ncbi:hypothetical protein I7E32_16360 [Alcaligenes faecalis]|nr:hypothetical protein [Alcaligenes faecalis]
MENEIITIEIPKEKYEELIRNSKLLNILFEYGIDEWEEALEEFNDLYGGK